MKNKIKFLVLILISILFININKVSAEVKECVYKRASDNDDKLVLRFDFDNSSFVQMHGNSFFRAIGIEASFIDYPLDPFFQASGDTFESLAKQMIEKQACPKYIFDFNTIIFNVYGLKCDGVSYDWNQVKENKEKIFKQMKEDKCVFRLYGTSGWQRGMSIFHDAEIGEEHRSYVFNEDLLITSNKEEFINPFTKLPGFSGPFNAIRFKDSNDDSNLVWTYSEQDSDIKKSFEFKFTCKKYKEYFDSSTTEKYKNLNNLKDSDLEDLTLNQLDYLYAKNCKNSKTSKCKKLYSSYSLKKTIVNNWCRSIVSLRSSKSACLNACLDNASNFSKLNIEKGNQEKTKCNVSLNIIAIIYNFLKWIKYIAPVLVIILSMIDFLKALASQDNDAMKKAQQKFIKRLVSAALLFLLPLIIDYILNLLNLYDQSCDITTIFGK